MPALHENKTCIINCQYSTVSEQEENKWFCYSCEPGVCSIVKKSVRPWNVILCMCVTVLDQCRSHVYSQMIIWRWCLAGSLICHRSFKAKLIQCFWQYTRVCHCHSAFRGVCICIYLIFLKHKLMVLRECHFTEHVIKSVSQSMHEWRALPERGVSLLLLLSAVAISAVASLIVLQAILFKFELTA